MFNNELDDDLDIYINTNNTNNTRNINNTRNNVHSNVNTNNNTNNNTNPPINTNNNINAHSNVNTNNTNPLNINDLMDQLQKLPQDKRSKLLKSMNLPDNVQEHKLGSPQERKNSVRERLQKKLQKKV